MTPQNCPADTDLARLLDGEQVLDAASHLESCPRCRARLERLAAGDATWDAVAGGLAQPTTPVPELAAAMAALKMAVGNPDVEPSFESCADLPAGFLAPSHQSGHLGRIGDYEVLEEVGRGDMGIVFKAIDEKLQRVVALKVLSPRLAGHASSRKRFIREARAAAAVCHEHVVTLYAVDEAEALPYLVMEFVAGNRCSSGWRKTAPWRWRKSCGSGCKWRKGWRRPTPRDWCTATSSRRTFCWKTASSG